MAEHDLDNPDYARFAWGRFTYLLRWMALASAVAAALALFVLHRTTGPMPWHMIIAVSLGVFFTVFLTAVLMGLVFLSSGSGHDDKIQDPTRPEEDR